MAAPAAIYIACDHDVNYSGASIAKTGAPLNAGTCTYALTTEGGVAVPGGTGTLAYVADSDGDYAGTIESAVTVDLAEDALYYLTITFAETPYNDRRREPLRAAYRR